MSWSRMVFLAALLVLGAMMGMGGCAAKPAISDIRSDVVKVQISAGLFMTSDPQEVRAEAQRGCAEYGNVISHALSERCVRPDGLGGCLMKEYLFACKPRDAQEG